MTIYMQAEIQIFDFRPDQGEQPDSLSSAQLTSRLFVFLLQKKNKIPASQQTVGVDNRNCLITASCQLSPQWGGG